MRSIPETREGPPSRRLPRPDLSKVQYSLCFHMAFYSAARQVYNRMASVYEKQRKFDDAIAMSGVHDFVSTWTWGQTWPSLEGITRP